MNFFLDSIFKDKYNRNLAFIISIILAIFLVGIINLELEYDDHPCGPKKVLGRCYHIERVVCEDTYKAFEQECLNFIKTLNLPEARLLAPIQNMCQISKFDKILQYKRASSEFCNEEHKKLQNWRRTNPQFN